MNILVVDNITLILSAVILLLTVFIVMMNPFLRSPFRSWVKGTEDEQEDSNTEDNADAASKLPPLSIILAPHDQAVSLQRNLPALLHQDYPAGYQVIVVREVSDRDTDDVLKRIREEYEANPGDATLYVTSILDSSRFMSRKKLAVTLGVKAAKTEWIVLTEATCVPASDKWLQRMAGLCDPEVNLVIGYTQYDNTTPLLPRFERLYKASYLMREDTQGTAYCTEGANLMFRKEDFMNGDGYLGNLQLIHGTFDFIINKYAKPYSTRLQLNPEAWMTEEQPTKKSWMNRHVFYQETRRFLARSIAHRALFDADQLGLHLFVWMCIGTGIFAGVTFRWILLAFSVLMLIAGWITRTVLSLRVVRKFDLQVPFLFYIPYELSLIWHNLNYMLRHRFANKLEFTTHKQ